MSVLNFYLATSSWYIASQSTSSWNTFPPCSVEELADGNDVVEEDDVAHDREEDEGEERGGGGDEMEGEEREDWGECWAAVGVGEDTPLSPHDEERDEEEGNGRWGLEERGREVAEEVEELGKEFRGFGATRGGVLLPALVGDGKDPTHGQSAKSAGGETSTLSRAGEGGGDSVLHAFGGATTSLPLIPFSRCPSVSSVL